MGERSCDGNAAALVQRHQGELPGVGTVRWLERERRKTDGRAEVLNCRTCDCTGWRGPGDGLVAGDVTPEKLGRGAGFSGMGVVDRDSSNQVEPCSFFKRGSGGT